MAKNVAPRSFKQFLVSGHQFWATPIAFTEGFPGFSPAGKCPSSWSFFKFCARRLSKKSTDIFRSCETWPRTYTRIVPCKPKQMLSGQHYLLNLQCLILQILQRGLRIERSPAIWRNWNNPLRGMQRYARLIEMAEAFRQQIKAGSILPVNLPPVKVRSTTHGAAISFWAFMAVWYFCYLGMGQNLVPLVNPKIAGKWMFIP